MLKGIPVILSPELLKFLMEMGHGDTIVIADGNFPAASVAQRLVRADGHSSAALLDAILTLFPLDTFVQHSATLMAVVPGDDYDPAIWPEYQQIIGKHDTFREFAMVERLAFYEQAQNAYAVIASGESARYANIILTKGLVAGN